MYTIGFICVINMLLSISFGATNVIRPECGFDLVNGYIFYFESYQLLPVLSEWMYLLGLIAYLLWDITTLCLYVLQIKKFRGIKSIKIRPVTLNLYKITILTLFYQILALFLFIISFAH